MNEQIKFIIIGTGNIAITYLKAIDKIPLGKVVGFISRSRQEPTDHNELPVFESLSKVDIPFDAVIICTPNGLHHVSAIEAAGMGKHILCEKPIDITLENIDLMIQSSDENNVKLGVAYQRRFSGDHPRVKALIDSGQLGRIFSVDLAIKNYRDDAYYNSAPYRGTYKIDGGGPFIQQASHYIDLYHWFFGYPDQIVSKMAKFVHDIEVEDHGVAICTHNYGLISTITASTATKPGFPAKMEIYSEKGYLILINDMITDWEMDGISKPDAAAIDNQHTGSATAVVEDTTNHEFIINDFISAIKNDVEPRITGASARMATKFILEIYDSQF
ncbi:Gfo/Idh/MocA family protein [Portibacter marinus]|uniref:Gfo/Idh/MocA family protein n=1 Tax=Portibacter marinus TaxID=2898660 RepID=UPI001F4893AB|nr:Gfo/Idh/MocA family oxidoreductase [Portibacter marinus]